MGFFKKEPTMVEKINKMTKKETKKPEERKETETAGAVAVLNDKDCPKHGNLKTRGRTFEGKVIRKFPKRVVIEFERMLYVRKYERYAKAKTKIHARLPVCMEKEINVGDLIKIQECRPLSKMIHFAVIEKVNDEKEKK